MADHDTSSRRFKMLFRLTLLGGAVMVSLVFSLEVVRISFLSFILMVSLALIITAFFTIAFAPTVLRGLGYWFPKVELLSARFDRWLQVDTTGNGAS
ncbi:hypothetical protein [Pseudaestuariivita rosea]|uniref:hypothetical protein n=1 Tax=Pseudaestuariivita rosea TaxID=2763263 RepID=UPI001ABAC004|nr:hypothetical protein [Pseudaestuariivita rosea]